MSANSLLREPDSDGFHRRLDSNVFSHRLVSGLWCCAFHAKNTLPTTYQRWLSFPLNSYGLERQYSLQELHGPMERFHSESVSGIELDLDALFAP